MYKAMDLSKYIVSKCIEDGHPISNLQLQKILYYIQKDFLSRGDQAFEDEIEAWQFGPVIPDVYYHYCGFGSMPISFQFEKYEIDPTDREYVDEIVEHKRNLNPWDLVEETHKKNGAWDQVYCNGKGNHKVIPIELIRKAG